MKNIKILNDYIKAYNKAKEAKKLLSENKMKIIKYLEENSSSKLKYKDKTFTICEKKNFLYSDLVIEMQEAVSKQKKIEEMTEEAKVKSISKYIRMDTNA